MDKKTQGKKNREAGRNFENKVRAYLEKAWIVDRWTNQVEFIENYHEVNEEGLKHGVKYSYGKLVPCKPKFNPFTHSLMMNSAGFPDFIAFRKLLIPGEPYEIIGIECKGGDEKHKYLDAEEKEKCKWLLDNSIFSRILIAIGRASCRERV